MRPLAPKGGNDNVQTPDDLARWIVDHFLPCGRVLEPCRGEGAFYRAILQSRIPAIRDLQWCEVKDGRDFFSWHTKIDWIVTNPPWSQFRPFLAHSMKVADNIVFLSLLNAWYMKARLRDIHESGFGFVETCCLDTPPKPWPQTGFQLAAVHIQRGYEGPVKFNYP